jgi:aminoglycoside phosphotransferase (APT) family kinase protein
VAQQDAATIVRPLTLDWVGRHLEVGERVIGAEALHGGITAEMRKLIVGTRGGVVRHLVVRSFVESFALRYAGDWLHRESRALRMLAGTGLPAPGLIAVDSTAAYCEYPSLLMTHMPGRTVLVDEGLETRVPLMARQLVAIHALRTIDRPREYQTLTTADTVVMLPRANEEVWAAAIDVIRRPAPPFEGRILHRDFQPGNVLFDVPGSASTQITGVVDWAGMAWGPADFDVAHCSTNLALLHGPEWGLRFATEYDKAGGVLSETARERQYWRVRDALACSGELQLWAQPWREAGRADLTERVVEDRLDTYISIVMSAQA